MKFLLDTNVVSEPLQKRPRLEVVEWLAARDPFSLHISAVTFAEVEEGIALLPEGWRRHRLQSWRDQLARSTADRLIPVGLEIATVWGALRARTSQAGRTMAHVDAFIAATAEVHGLTLVTRNVKDFEAWGGPLLDPWNG